MSPLPILSRFLRKNEMFERVGKLPQRRTEDDLCGADFAEDVRAVLRRDAVV